MRPGGDSSTTAPPITARARARSRARARCRTRRRPPPGRSGRRRAARARPGPRARRPRPRARRLAVGVRPQRHARPGRRVHERVLEQHADHLEHAQLVGARDRAALDRDLDRMAARSATTPELLGDRLRDLAEVDRLVLDPHPARVEPREVEQVGGELRQPLDLLAHRRQELAPRLLVELLVRQQLEEAAEREERRPQLVRGVGDELAARAVELRQPLAHPLEGVRQLPDLVVARSTTGSSSRPAAIRSAARSSRRDPARVQRGEHVAATAANSSPIRPATSSRRWTSGRSRAGRRASR